MIEVSASVLQGLLEVLYTLVIDYQESGARKSGAQCAAQLRNLTPEVTRWSKILPGLKAAVQAAISGKDKLTQLVLLGHEIKDNFAQLKVNNQFTLDELKVLSALGQFLRTDSEGSLKTIQKMASIAHSPWVSQKFVPEVGSQKSSERLLEKVVQQLVGRKDDVLSMEEAKVARDTNPELYKEYLALRRAFNQVWKDAMVGYIRSTGQTFVPYEDVLNALNGHGITHGLLPGFTGLVDDRGRFYTDSGDLIVGVPNTATYSEIKMNPRQGPESPWVFQALKIDGSQSTYYYTKHFAQDQAQSKFDKVAKLYKKLPQVRAKWFTQVKKFDPTSVNSVCSNILEMLYQFSARVGTKGNTTFGIATLQVRHLKVQPTQIVIQYKGKDSVATKHVVQKADPEQKFLYANLIQLIEGKGPKDPVFTVHQGEKQKYVGPISSNKLFKALTGMPDITVHKIRTYRATSLFMEEKAKIMPMLMKKKNLTEQEVTQICKKLAEKVGTLLNHVRRGAAGTKVTGVTALASYIDPSASLTLFSDLGFRPPAFLEKFQTAE